MERVDKIQHEAQGLARSAYLQEGLKRAFVACHEPLPAKMEQLLEELQRMEREGELN